MNYFFRTHLEITSYFNVSYLVLIGYNIRILHVWYLLLTQLKIEMKRESIQSITGRITP